LINLEKHFQKKLRIKSLLIILTTQSLHMKRLFAFYNSFIIIIITFFSCSNQKQSAVEYDQLISKHFEAFNKQFMNYSMTLNGDSFLNKEENRINTLKFTDNTLDTLANIKDFENDETLLNSFKSFLKTIRICLIGCDSVRISLQRGDYLNIDENKSKIKELTSQSLLACDKAFLEFNNAQKKFRDKFEITSK